VQGRDTLVRRKALMAPETFSPAAYPGPNLTGVDNL